MKAQKQEQSEIIIEKLTLGMARVWIKGTTAPRPSIRLNRSWSRLKR